MKTTDRRRLFRFGKIFWPSSGIRAAHGFPCDWGCFCSRAYMCVCVCFCFELDVLIRWTNGSMKRQYIHSCSPSVKIANECWMIPEVCACFGQKIRESATVATAHKTLYYLFFWRLFSVRIFSELHCRPPFSLFIGDSSLCLRVQNGNSPIVRFMVGDCHRTSIVFIK